MTTGSKPSRYIAWNLRALMDQRKLRRNQDLHRLLVDAGVKISSTQLARVVSQRPKRLTTEFLDALVTVLECDIADLMTVEMSEQSEPPAHAQQVIPISKKRPAIF